MSESFVAVESGAAGLMYNPATVGNFPGISTIHSTRDYSYDRYTNGWRYAMMGVSFSTPSFSAGALYNRFSQGITAFSTNQNPDSFFVHINNYNYLIALGASYKVTDRLTIGSSIKMFSTVDDVVEGDFVLHEEIGPDSLWSGSSFQDAYAQSYYIDIGAIYLLDGFFQQGVCNDEITIGGSLQNFGTPHRFKFTNYEYVEKFPRYVRLGFSYRLMLNSKENQDETWLQILVTTQYSNLLNGGVTQNRHIFSYGFEATLYEIISARISGFNSSISSRYTPYNSDRFTPGVRYGLGVAIPLPFLIAGNQMHLQIDYAQIPIYFREYRQGLSWRDVITEERRLTLHSFSIALNYLIN